MYQAGSTTAADSLVHYPRSLAARTEDIPFLTPFRLEMLYFAILAASGSTSGKHVMASLGRSNSKVYFDMPAGGV